MKPVRTVKYKLEIMLPQIVRPSFMLVNSQRQNIQPGSCSASCYKMKVREVDSFSSYQISSPVSRLCLHYFMFTNNFFPSLLPVENVTCDISDFKEDICHLTPTAQKNEDCVTFLYCSSSARFLFKYNTCPIDHYIQLLILRAFMAKIFNKISG